MGVSDITGPDRELDAKYRLLDEIIDRYSEKSGQLIRILQEAQGIFGYLPEEVQTYIAGRTGIPVSEVNGVVTFYSLFSTEPRGEYGIDVCLGTACYVKGAQGIIDDFRRDLSIKDGDTSPDGLFTVRSTRCIGACGLAPVITVNGEVYGNLGRRDVSKVLRKYRKIHEAGEIKDDQRPERPAGDQEQAPAGT